MNIRQRREADYSAHLFLDALFVLDKEISKAFHELQIQFYIDFDRPKLLNFLQETENYGAKRAVELCKRAGMYKEMSLVYFKMG